MPAGQIVEIDIADNLSGFLHTDRADGPQPIGWDFGQLRDAPARQRGDIIPIRRQPKTEKSCGFVDATSFGSRERLLRQQSQQQSLGRNVVAHHPRLSAWRKGLASEPFDAAATSPRPNQWAMRRSSGAAASAVRLRIDALFTMRGIDAQESLLAIGLEAETRRQPVALEEGQHIITVDALLLRRIDLDPVAEVEQAFGARAFPNQRIER